MSCVSGRKRSHIFRSACSVAVLAVASLPAPIALAQDDPAASQTASDDEEVVVTAQRRSEAVRKVPIAVTVISGENIENLNLTTIDKISSVTPALVFDKANAFPQSFIRGIGVPTSTPGLEAPIAIYIDGAYTPRSNGTLIDMVDVANVQVLKGPQGTLYGRNATGGAILVTTADPTDVLEGRASFEYGRFNHVRTEVVANIPVNDELAVRFAGNYAKEDGFIQNTFTGNDLRGYETYLVRGKLKWTPSPNFTAVLGGEYRHNTAQSLSTNRQAALPPFCLPCNLGAQITPGFYDTRQDIEFENPEQGRSANLALTYDHGPITLKSTTSWTTVDYLTGYDIDHTELPLFGIDFDFGGKTFEQNFQISTSLDGQLNFLAGLQYIHDEAYARNAQSGSLLGIPYNVPRDQKHYTDNDVFSDSFAVYAEVYWKPTDRLTVTLGGRYSTDDREFAVRLSPIAQARARLASNTFTQEFSFESFTPRAVVAYDLSGDYGDLNLYASYTEGFKAGGLSAPLFAPGTPVSPETIASYEFGAKFVSPDRRTHVNFAAFYYDYDDVQTSIVDATNGTKKVVNAASARGQGAELEITHRATDWLLLSLGVAYLDAKFVDYPNAPQFVVSRNSSGAPTGFVDGVVDLSGHRLPRAPEWTVNFGFDINTPLWTGWVGRLTGNVHYTSDYDFTIGAGGPERIDVQPAMTLVNISGGIGPDTGEYEIGFYIDNATDEEYNYLLSTGTFGLDAYAAKPITYGLRVKVAFNPTE